MQDDIDRFVILFAQHQRKIHAYIGALLPSRSDADDVMQETSLTLWQKWDSYDQSKDFCRWAFGVAHIEVLRHRRKYATSRLFFSEDLINSIADELLTQSDNADMKSEALALCLEQLGKTDRQLIEHCYSSGATAVRTAEELGRPLSTVYKGLARIRRLLYSCIQRRLAQEIG